MLLGRDELSQEKSRYERFEHEHVEIVQRQEADF